MYPLFSFYRKLINCNYIFIVGTFFCVEVSFITPQQLLFLQSLKMKAKFYVYFKRSRLLLLRMNHCAAESISIDSKKVNFEMI